MSVVFRYVNGVYTNIEDVTFPEDLPKIISLTELRNILGIECFHDKDTGVNSFLVRKLTELGYHQYNGRNPKDGTKGRFYYKR